MIGSDFFLIFDNILFNFPEPFLHFLKSTLNFLFYFLQFQLNPLFYLFKLNLTSLLNSLEHEHYLLIIGKIKCFFLLLKHLNKMLSGSVFRHFCLCLELLLLLLHHVCVHVPLFIFSEFSFKQSNAQRLFLIFYLD